MFEYIGNVKLNLTYYLGEDLYSEGGIEDELLSIVKQYKVYDNIIANDKRWPILYHLSKYRANIIEWIPITKSDSVLEIGAGCGAITKTLADKSGHVTCVELSKKRSEINAFRNSEKKQS